MAGSVEDLATPDSWEVADLDGSMSRLLLPKRDPQLSNLPSTSCSSAPSRDHTGVSASAPATSPALARAPSSGDISEDLVNSVDQFLRDALQNPRERLSVLRMEQDVEKFIRDSSQQQMEFQQLPTSYLRLAAHRVAQHYSLQSMVLLDNNLPDSSGSRIIIRKTSECKLPLIRLADIPVNLPTEDPSSGVIKVAIKQRPQKRSQVVSTTNSHSLKTNSSKSVEERKEEYNRARARIFSSSSSSSSSGCATAKPESEARRQELSQLGSLGISNIEEIAGPGGNDLNITSGFMDSSRTARSKTEKEPVGRTRSNNGRVAIFRDRDVERKDPDYDRSYDRYVQRFDPGFGFSGGSYPIQPMYSPVLNYNTEFPQLSSAIGSPISTEPQSRSLPQHLPVPWVAPSSPAGIRYATPEAGIPPFSPNHVTAHSASTLYLQYPSHRPGVPFIHPHEQVHQPFSQSHQQQSDATFGLARPR